MAKTVKAALAEGTELLRAAGIESAHTDARKLLMYICGLTRADLIANPDGVLSGSDIKAYHAQVARRAKHEPLAYITGKQAFWTLDLQVTPDTLIPRPETEEIVRHGLEAIVNIDSPRILDVGTGSGAILISILSERNDATGVGVDISLGALEVAKTNAKTAGLDEQAGFIQTDIFGGITGPFDLIVSNPPYIQSAMISALDQDVRDYEPDDALDGGADGLRFYRIIAREAKPFLKPGGTLVLEIGYDQGRSVPSLLSEHGFKAIEVHQDLADHDRVVTAKP